MNTVANAHSRVAVAHSDLHQGAPQVDNNAGSRRGEASGGNRDRVREDGGVHQRDVGDKNPFLYQGQAIHASTV